MNLKTASFFCVSSNALPGVRGGGGGTMEKDVLHDTELLGNG